MLAASPRKDQMKITINERSADVIYALVISNIHAATHLSGPRGMMDEYTTVVVYRAIKEAIDRLKIE